MVGDHAGRRGDAHRCADVDTVGHANSVADTEPDFTANRVTHRSAAHAFEHADTAAVRPSPRKYQAAVLLPPYPPRAAQARR